METSTPVLPDIDSGVWTKDEPTPVKVKSRHWKKALRDGKHLVPGMDKEKRCVHANGVNAKLTGALHNDHDPDYLLYHEKPVHRTMVRMAEEGFDTKAIAQFTGYSTSHVSNVLRQPFARAAMIEHAEKRFEDELKDLLQSEVIPSVETLTEIRDDKEAPKAVRAQSAQYLVDRWLGKPTQPIENKAATEPAKLTTQELESRVNSIIAGVPTPPGDPDRH